MDTVEFLIMGVISVDESRRRGWGMGLYRNRSEGWVGGVCAGLAAHWDVPNWVVRLAVVALLMFTGSLAFWLYMLAWVVIALCGARQFLAGRRHAPGMTLAGAGAALQAVDMRTVALRGALLLLFCASLLKLSAQSYSPFLYFQF